MPSPLISEEELAARWKITPITLSQWRWSGRSPRYVKIGRHIFYRPKDVELFEEQKAKKSTTQTFNEDLIMRNSNSLKNMEKYTKYRREKCN